MNDPGECWRVNDPAGRQHLVYAVPSGYVPWSTYTPQDGMGWIGHSVVTWLVNVLVFRAVGRSWCGGATTSPRNGRAWSGAATSPGRKRSPTRPARRGTSRGRGCSRSDRPRAAGEAARQNPQIVPEEEGSRRRHRRHGSPPGPHAHPQQTHDALVIRP